MSDPLRSHRRQPNRLLHPRDFPGKSSGVGCYCLLCIILNGHAKNIFHYLAFLLLNFKVFSSHQNKIQNLLHGLQRTTCQTPDLCLSSPWFPSKWFHFNYIGVFLPSTISLIAINAWNTFSQMTSVLLRSVLNIHFIILFIITLKFLCLHLFFIICITYYLRILPIFFSLLSTFHQNQKYKFHENNHLWISCSLLYSSVSKMWLIHIRTETFMKYLAVSPSKFMIYKQLLLSQLNPLIYMKWV